MMGDLDITSKAIFKEMLLINQLRGKDATGAMKVGCDNSVNYLKRLGTPEYLFDSKTYDKDIEQGLVKVLLGHCRSRTIGENSIKNAHPFKQEPLWGVHNGTLMAHYGMEGAREYGTDSEFLYAHAAKYGMEETVQKLDDDGAWCLVWWNSDDKTMNFLRNDKRPLYFTHSKDKKTLYWASEPWFFGVIDRRVGKDLWDEGPYPLPVNTLMSFSVDGFGKTPEDIFKLHPPKEVKGEVRGHQGNAWSRGVYGANYAGNVRRIGHQGGEVADPFLDDLDDNLEDLETRHFGSALQKTAGTPTPAGVTIIDSTSKKSKDISQAISASEALSKRQNGYSREKLSPRLPHSLLVPQGNKEGSSKPFVEPTVNCRTNMARQRRTGVSLRAISGVEYITDNVTGREFTYDKFGEMTLGLCCWCDSPIGGLEEVENIIVKKEGTFDEDVKFLCKDCSNPKVV